jgi:hypothetical protein
LGTLHVIQNQPFNNLLNNDDATRFWERVDFSPLSFQTLRSDSNFISHHFSRPLWNTTFSDTGKILLYQFWINENVFICESKRGRRKQTSIQPAPLPQWQPEALSLRIDYLKRWLKRQLVIRLITNQTFAKLPFGDHTAIEYLNFFTAIDRRIALLAVWLAAINQEKNITPKRVLEAVRASDGFLRAWCESARIGMTT